MTPRLPQRADAAFDFHIHTRASDGAADAAGALRLAAGAGLAGVSLTDHDTVDAYAELELEAPRPDGGRPLRAPWVLPGIEVSTRLGEEEAHVLGYFPGGLTAAVREYSESILARRRERMVEGIVRLRERGIDISWKDCERLATGRVVSRNLIAQALVEKRYIGRPHRAYPDFVGPRVVPLPCERAEDAVRRIQELGGVSIWAHPSRNHVEAHLEALRGAGLEGVEVHIPRRPARERREMAERVRALGLLVTGGSDWHGRASGPELGHFRVAADLVGAFLDRVGGLERAERASDSSGAPP